MPRRSTITKAGTFRIQKWTRREKYNLKMVRRCQDFDTLTRAAYTALPPSH